MFFLEDLLKKEVGFPKYITEMFIYESELFKSLYLNKESELKFTYNIVQLRKKVLKIDIKNIKNENLYIHLKSKDNKILLRNITSENLF